MKFLLQVIFLLPNSSFSNILTSYQVAGSFADAFHELLDVYEKLGESFPLLDQYDRLFREDSNMLRVLTFIYKDILDFHLQALRYFQQPSMSLLLLLYLYPF